MLTLEKHQSNTDVRALPTSFPETVQIAPDMEHDAAGVAPVLAIGVALDADFVAVGCFGSDIDPFLEDAGIGGIYATKLAEGLEGFFVSASTGEPTG